MATVADLTPQQRDRFRQLRAEGKGNKARMFKQRALGGKSARQPGTDASGQVVFGPQLSKQLAQGEAFGQKLVEQFLPNIDTLGTLDSSRPAETQNLINQQQAFTDQAGVLSDEAKKALSLAEGGLGGLTAAENDALRARGFEGLNREFQGGLRQLASAQGRAGVTGAAGTAGVADLIRGRLDGVGALERDILLSNIDVQDRRRQGFADLVNTLDTNRFNQQSQALDRLGALTSAAQDAQLQREIFNLGQNEKLLSGQQSLFFGGQGILDARRTAVQNAREAARQRAAAIAEANARAQAASQAASSQAALLSRLNLPSLF